MQIDFDCHGYDVTVDIHGERDPYGTGDSPMLYEVDIQSVYDEDGNEVDESELGAWLYNEIVSEAIEVYKS